jgi:hypothetical protein
VKGSDGFAPLTVVRIRDTVRIDRPLSEKVEWTNADFGHLFLLWIAGEYPACRNAWVNVNDIEDEFYVRFIEAAGYRNLQLGALLRGLGEVTAKRERSCTDFTGKRRSVTEYKVPKAASNVVDLAAAERKRA